MGEAEKFADLKAELANVLEPATINAEKCSWDFYINSTQDNMQKYEESQDEYSKIFQDKKMYEKFLRIDSSKLSKHDAKQLKDILKEYDEELNTGDALKALRKRENEIAAKINSYIPKIDGKEVSKTELTKILQTDDNAELRKKAYNARIAGGDLIAEDLIDFVKMRNEYAKTKGFENYFDYKLKESYDVDSVFLDKILAEVYSKAEVKIKEVQSKKIQELKEHFGTDVLEGYHYGLLLDSNPEKEVNKILENQDVETLSKKIYSKMGYDIDKMVECGKLTLDLYPRKGKNTHGFCFGVEAGKDSRILANLTNNVISLDTLNHELGHCVYDLGISTKLQFFDKAPSSSAFTEAIAMMTGDIIKTEDVLSDIIPDDVFQKFKQSHIEDEASFVAKSLLIIDFERELYKNPEINPAQLWQKLRKKYLMRNDKADNEWATIPHYLSHPAYYQNYFRAAIMKAQVYSYLKSVLGNLTENNRSAKFMDENIFSVGASVEEYDLIRQLTGKDFSVDDFVSSIQG